MRAASRPAANGRDRRHKSRGQSFVEFALVAPVLLLLLLITLDFGRMFMSYVTLNNVARVAANFGSVNPAELHGFAQHDDLRHDRQPRGGGAELSVARWSRSRLPQSAHPDLPDGSSLGDDSVVQLTCDFTPLTPLIGAIIGAPFPISAELLSGPHRRDCEHRRQFDATASGRAVRGVHHQRRHRRNGRRLRERYRDPAVTVTSRTARSTPRPMTGTGATAPRMTSPPHPCRTRIRAIDLHPDPDDHQFAGIRQLLGERSASVGLRLPRRRLPRLCSRSTARPRVASRRWMVVGQAGN